MSDRNTPHARQAVQRAQEEARGLGHASVGPEHLLVGLAGVEGSVATRALASLGLDADRARAEVERVAGRGAGAGHGQVPFHPAARRTLDQALREAMSLGQEEVGTEHVLLALVNERSGYAARVLEAVAHPGVVRDAVLATMAEPVPAGAATDDAPTVDRLPDSVSVRLGDDVRALLRRAAGQALVGGERELTVDHVRRALEP